MQKRRRVALYRTLCRTHPFLVPQLLHSSITPAPPPAETDPGATTIPLPLWFEFGVVSSELGFFILEGGRETGKEWQRKSKSTKVKTKYYHTMYGAYTMYRGFVGPSPISTLFMIGFTDYLLKLLASKS